jgi:hypothetical protein
MLPSGEASKERMGCSRMDCRKGREGGREGGREERGRVSIEQRREGEREGGREGDRTSYLVDALQELGRQILPL